MTKLFVIETPNTITDKQGKNIIKKLEKVFKKKKIDALPIILTDGLRASLLDPSEYQ